MAGFIFSISSESGLDGLRERILLGNYASITPEIDGNMSRQVVAAVLADYCSMKEGDNVYFLSKRQIYGVGKLINIGQDCKYKNYISACEFVKKDEFDENDNPLTGTSPLFRWICFFEPDSIFFDKGIDMDEVLTYKPSSFRMLRAFQDSTFIKIDDEENQALKECIYLKNRGNGNAFEYSDEDHRRIETFDLSNYLIHTSETLKNEINPITSELNLEMLLEAALVEKIGREGFEDERYDYITHQVIASPFKPLAYIDKMDIFGYQFLPNFPNEPKPISQYLVIELKKGKANSEMPLQLMRYVDWISREYAAGDYSKIRAVGVAKEYTQKIQETLDNDCVRSYLCDTHPNVTKKWDNLELYEYVVDASGQVSLHKGDYHDWISILKKKIEEIGFVCAKTKITVKGVNFAPTFKISELKVACFQEISERECNILEESGWNVVVIDNIDGYESINNIMHQIFSCKKN